MSDPVEWAYLRDGSGWSPEATKRQADSPPRSLAEDLRRQLGEMEAERDRWRREAETRAKVDDLVRELSETQRDRNRWRDQAIARGRRVTELEHEKINGYFSRVQPPAPAADSVIAAAIGELVKKWHPDRGAQIDATVVVAELNRLRDKARGKR